VHLTSSATGPDDGVASPMPSVGGPMLHLLKSNSVARSGARGVRPKVRQMNRCVCCLVALALIGWCSSCTCSTIPAASSSASSYDKAVSVIPLWDPSDKLVRSIPWGCLEKKLTIEEAEKYVSAPRRPLPQEWLRLKSLLRPGDEVWSFSCGGGLSSMAGIAILRGGKFVDGWVISVS
jgi:hypothetical protein